MDRANKSITIFKFLTAVGDTIIVYCCVILALNLTFMNVNITQESLASVKSALPYICISVLILFYVYGLYTILNKSSSEIILSIAIIVFITMFVTMSLTFFLRGFAFPRSTVVFAAIFEFIFLSAWRVLVLKLRQKIHGRQTMIIIGRGEQTIESTKKILISAKKIYEVKYVYDLENGFKGAKKLIKQVDHVFICSNISSEEKSIVFSYCMAKDTDVFIIPDLFDISMKNSRISQFDDIPTFRVNSIGITPEQKLLKRLFDIVFSFIAIIVLSPLMIIIAIAIKVSSKGPVLFKQERVTQNNKLYNVYKFRTMIKDAEKLTGPVLATEKDSRITAIGLFLRATRLDEIPQFFNVFLGDMSIVGPRPEREFFIEQFKKELPEFEYRVAVKAGITGLAQVMGKYTTTPEDKLRYDLLYIRNYSFGLDLQLLLQTVRIALTKESSSGIKNDITLDELAKNLGYKIFNRQEYFEFVKGR